MHSGHDGCEATRLPSGGTARSGWWGCPPAPPAFREGAAQAPWRILPRWFPAEQLSTLNGRPCCFHAGMYSSSEESGSV